MVPIRARLSGPRCDRVQQPGVEGAAHFYQSKGKHIITVKTEHKAVLDTCRELERQGFEVMYMDVQPDGLLDLEAFKAAIRPDTILASVMFVNNEIGVIQDVAAIGAIWREKGVVFHVDAAQATGRVAFDLSKPPIDLMSLTTRTRPMAPKASVPCLCAASRASVSKRKCMAVVMSAACVLGTLPTHQIVGMGEAYRIAKEEMAVENVRIQPCTTACWPV